MITLILVPPAYIYYSQSQIGISDVIDDIIQDGVASNLLWPKRVVIPTLDTEERKAGEKALLERLNDPSGSVSGRWLRSCMFVC